MPPYHHQRSISECEARGTEHYSVSLSTKTGRSLVTETAIRPSVTATKQPHRLIGRQLF
jgi:hypothetical protein